MKLGKVAAIAGLMVTTMSSLANGNESTPLPEPTLSFDFRESLTGRIHGVRTVAEQTGEGAYRIRARDGDLAFPRRGSLSVLFTLEGIDSTLNLPLRQRTTPAGGDETKGFSWLDTPLFQTQLFVSRRALGMNFNFRQAGGGTVMAQQLWSRMEGGKRYALTIAWDADEGTIESFINGIQQGDLRHWGRDYSNLDVAAGRMLSLGGALQDGETNVVFRTLAVRVDDTFMTNDMAQALAKTWQTDALAGEVRTLYDRPLDLEGMSLEKIYEADFVRPLAVVREEDLFEGERRKRRPDGAEWVLEGPGRVWTDNGVLHFSTAGEGDASGHLVLWNTREFPDNILVDYTFTPDDPWKGLHILFLSAGRPGGGDIFELDLPRREADFGRYTVGAIGSYHASVFASDDRDLRRTANMRKNPGFALVAVGEDRIGGSEKGKVHRIRALKMGGRVAFEVNGVVAVEFDDDGQSYGDVLGAGQIGIRLMEHTGRAQIHRFSVYQVSPDKP